MNYEVSEKKGDPVRVTLRELSENLFEVTIGGQTVQVDAVKSGATVYSVIEDGAHYEAVVDENGPHGFDILLHGRLYQLEALDERSVILASTAATVATGPQQVMAEMAGKVVKVNVAVGASVSEGEGIVIVEAMKMENEIPSPIDGVVTDVAVSEGQAVESGALLFVVEPPAAE